MESFLQELEKELGLSALPDYPVRTRQYAILNAIHLIKEAAQRSVQRTGEQSAAAFDNSDLYSDDREDSNPLFFTRR